MSKKPASIGAMVMLGGGLMIYWALSQWKLFGLGQPIVKRFGGPIPKSITGNAGPPVIDDNVHVSA
jgi:hypothetical protein